MNLRGIVGKLWLFMLSLVVLVLGVSALIQTQFLEKIYYNQQAARLLEEGQRLAEILVEQRDPLQAARQVVLLARLMNASVMVVNPQGVVEHWHVMGMMGRHMGKGPPGSWRNQQRDSLTYSLPPVDSTREGMAHMVPISQEQIEKVLAGQRLVFREHNPFFDTDVLLVGLPLKRGEEILGGLFIHAPVAPLAANIRALQHANLYALVLGAVLATLLGLLFSRTFARPLLEMDRIARAMAAGDFTRRVSIKSRDEIGLLAESLNTLSQELQEKIAALERLDAARKEFVANVSHELRTPLTIIQGYTEAILDGMAKDEAQRREYLQNILDEIVRLRRLVDDLLDLRRLESGRITLKKQPLDIEALLNQVVERFRNMAQEKGVSLELSLLTPLPPVVGDGDRLAQVFINLLDNALRVTPGGGKVSVAAKEAGGKVEVVVEDTGPGIPAHEIPLIWERFYKGDPSRRRDGGGSGLGLAIAKQIVELHGGRIYVESGPGKGARFVVVF